MSTERNQRSDSLAQAEQFHLRGQLSAAEHCYLQCLSRDRNNAGALFGLGVLRRSTGRHALAIPLFEQVQAFRPEFAPAHYEHGVCLAELGQSVPAFDSLVKAWQLGKADFQTASLLCELAHFLGRPADVEHWGQAALAINPDDFDLQRNLGIHFYTQRKRRQAAECLRRAFALSGTADLEVLSFLRLNLDQMCDWTDREAHCAILQAAAEQYGRKHPSIEQTAPAINPFITLYLFDSPALQLATASAYVGRAEPGRERFEYPSFGTKERVRVGYLSADFHEHATAMLMVDLLECHDRQRFSIYAYSWGPDDESPLTRRVRAAFDHFTDARQLTDDALAQRIHADQIDLLIDLKGHTRGARTGVLSRRPAPRIINYLGYPGSMGVPFVDAIIADHFLIPDHGDAASGYAENVIRLPFCYQPNDRHRPCPPMARREDVGLEADKLVLCSFNQTYKLSPEMFALWLDLLGQIPDAVLWLFAPDNDARQNLLAAAAARNVSESQLVFAERLPLEAHLARLACADIFLDAYPCNAHTTASEALWMGVPIVTISGRSFASRVAGSLLHACGLDDLIADSFARYREIVLALSRDRAALQGIKDRLRQGRLRLSIFDTPGYTRAFEAALMTLMPPKAAAT